MIESLVAAGAIATVVEKNL